MENTNIVKVDLSQELKQRYIDYAMSVIVKRALPDPRDGLKPVLRRILYAMCEGDNFYNKPYRKSARTVGDAMGKYHPHGDSSIYEAMVNAAQDFDMRYPLVDGHGNFGSLDGDGAAAMRYTEARLSQLGQAMLQDIDKNTVEMRDNFDSTLKEPSVLPSLFPNALANGVEGIAVGMATKMPPHNLTEVYNALIYIIDSVKAGQEPELAEIMKHIKGPDFPLGGQIVGSQGIYDAFTTGRGKIVMRSKYEIVETKRSIEMIVTEIPYKVNKASLVDKISQLSKKAIPEIKSVEDQSNKEGIHIVIELKKDCNVDLVINRLLKSGCGLQKTYSVNNTVIMDGVPKVVSTVELLEIFFKHSIEVVMKKTEFDYNKASARYAIVNAILWVLEEKLEEVISLIRSSDTQESAINNLKQLYAESRGGAEELTDEQARAIAEMRLRQLSKDNIERYTQEANNLSELIDYYSSVLTDQNVLFDVIQKQYIEMRDKFGDERRTEIVNDSSEIKEEDLVADETLVLTYTTDGIIKTVSETEYEVTNRGTKGTKSGSIKEDEAILYMQTIHSKDYIVFFTSLGKCYALRAFQIQKASRTSRGKSIYNYLPLQDGERIVSLVNIAPDAEGAFTLITKSGAGKRLSVKDLPQTSSGARAITFRDGDELIAAIFGQDEDNIMVTTRNGMSISFKAVDIRVMGRTASGVKAIDLKDDDVVVDATVLKSDETVLTVTELGLGKRTETSEFTIQSRGGKGVKVHKLNDKTGKLVCAMSVKEDDELFVATSYGLIVRTRVDAISTLGRNTSGVKIVKLNEGDSIVSISVVQKEEDDIEDGLQQ